MPEIIYYVAASLDGFIATPDGGVDWLMPFQQSGEDYGWANFVASVDAVLTGSRTYEQALTFGGSPGMGKPCWVFSSREIKPASPEVTITKASPAEVVADLAKQGARRAWLIGGTRLASSFRAAGLITEYDLAIIPVVLGGGVPLFESPGLGAKLKLASSKVHPSGVIQLRYRVGPA